MALIQTVDYAYRRWESDLGKPTEVTLSNSIYQRPLAHISGFSAEIA